ncbi:hypothetical protein vseg_001182 [Gypsophila vaccaria]
MENSTSPYFLSLLITLLVTSKVTLVIAIRPTTTTTTTTTIYTDFIKTSCKATTYPQLCYNSLFNHASVIQTSPQLLANAALSVTLDTTRTTSTAMSAMSRHLGIRTKEVGPMRDCLEELNDTIGQLKNSIKEMGQMKSSSSTYKFGLLMSDVQTWVSAAMTNEATCMDGFGGKVMDSSLKTTIRGKIMNICHLTSNSLALINSFATLHG